eukprot:m.78644 g.78644  ORF g.78644 m.78644 type:complete len:68 (+) comp16248_c1_seq5:1637-1840(+)
MPCAVVLHFCMPGDTRHEACILSTLACKLLAYVVERGIASPIPSEEWVIPPTWALSYGTPHLVDNLY